MTKHRDKETKAKAKTLKAYKTRPDKDLRQLALDLSDGKIFTSAHLGEQKDSLLHMVFMPMAFFEKEDVEQLTTDEITVIFEYKDKAGPRGVNGFPMFASFQTLDKADTEKVWEYAAELEEHKKKFVTEDEDEN